MKWSVVLILSVVWCADYVRSTNSGVPSNRIKLCNLLNNRFWQDLKKFKIHDTTFGDMIKDSKTEYGHFSLNINELTTPLKAVRTYISCEFCYLMRRWWTGLDALTAQVFAYLKGRSSSPYSDYVEKWTTWVRPSVKEAKGTLALWSAFFLAFSHEIPWLEEQDQAILNLAQTLDRFVSGQDTQLWGTSSGHKYSRLTLMQATIRDMLDRYAENYCEWPESKWFLPENVEGVDYPVGEDLAKTTMSEVDEQLKTIFEDLKLADWLDFLPVTVAAPYPSKILNTDIEVKWLWNGVMRSVDEVYAEVTHDYRADLLDDYSFLAYQTAKITFLVYLSDLLTFYSNNYMTEHTSRFAIIYTQDPIHLKHVRKMVKEFSTYEESTNCSDKFIERLRNRIERPPPNYNQALTVENLHLMIRNHLNALDAFLKIALKNNLHDLPAQIVSEHINKTNKIDINEKRMRLLEYNIQLL